MGIQSSASDDCVRILTENGATSQRPEKGAKACRSRSTPKAMLCSGRLAWLTEQVWQRLAAHNPSRRSCHERRGTEVTVGIRAVHRFVGRHRQTHQRVFDAYKHGLPRFFERRQRHTRRRSGKSRTAQNGSRSEARPTGTVAVRSLAVAAPGPRWHRRGPGGRCRREHRSVNPA